MTTAPVRPVPVPSRHLVVHTVPVIDEDDAGSDPEKVRRPFGALNEASYHLDSVSEPWSVHVEARLSGTVIGDRLRQAVGSGARQGAPGSRASAHCPPAAA